MPVARICQKCGAGFTCKPSDIKRRGALFCSYKCSGNGRVVRPMAERLWSKVDRSGDCWLWTAATVNGYGSIQSGSGGTVLTHRAAYVLASGNPIPEGFDVLHACDVRPCVRNDEEGVYKVGDILRPRFGHLWLGTAADNVRDMHMKGRAVNDLFKAWETRRRNAAAR